jgi:hypothetical protein
MQIQREQRHLSDRYAFDNVLLPADGWAQFDTAQDAPYFGKWVNPFERKLISFTEGDVCIQTAESDDEFRATLAIDLVWQMDNFRRFRPSIDCALTIGKEKDIHAKLTEFGFGDWLA